METVTHGWTWTLKCTSQSANKKLNCCMFTCRRMMSSSCLLQGIPFILSCGRSAGHPALSSVAICQRDCWSCSCLWRFKSTSFPPFLHNNNGHPISNPALQDGHSLADHSWMSSVCLSRDRYPSHLNRCLLLHCNSCSNISGGIPYSSRMQSSQKDVNI